MTTLEDDIATLKDLEKIAKEWALAISCGAHPSPDQLQHIMLTLARAVIMAGEQRGVFLKATTSPRTP